MVRRACVIVQGDLGRSPRMQYQAHALAECGIDVDLVGLSGVEVAAPVLGHPRIHCHVIVDRRGRRRALATIGRLFRLTAAMGRCLFGLRSPELVLVQVPPVAPGAIVAWLWARWHGARFALDWHNLGWTVLQLDSGGTAAPSALRRLEAWLGRRADTHVTVSEALSRHLTQWLGLSPSPTVIYDRAPSWLNRVADSTSVAMRAAVCAACGVPSDSAVLVSPTSWTSDETMDLLIDAADALERRGRLPTNPGHVLLLATGQGPGREAFEARLGSRPSGARTTVGTHWVATGDYATLLATADAGVCLHRSSSGLDLPMKIADMRAVGLPVLARRYPALSERLSDGIDALLFDDAEGLAEHIETLWSPAGGALRERLRAASAAAGRDGWLAGWAREARAILVDGQDA